MAVPLTQKAVVTCLQSPGAQHAAWFRELQCESMLMAVHDNLYKMEEYAVHSSAEAYVGTLGKQTRSTTESLLQGRCHCGDAGFSPPDELASLILFCAITWKDSLAFDQMQHDAFFWL